MDLTNLSFQAAYNYMKAGNDITLPEWGGFWRWKNDTIMIHTREGDVFDIRQTEQLDYTLNFMFRNDWIVL